MTIRSKTLPACLAAMLALAACTHNSTNPPATISNISGDYTGTVQDSVTGAATATATLAQHGASAGGPLSMTAGSTTLTGALALVITTSNSLSGTLVEDLPSGTTCTFSTSGSYDTSNSQITGSYTAITGCTGQTGTYTLAQQCTDTPTSTARRTFGVPKC